MTFEMVIEILKVAGPMGSGLIFLLGILVWAGSFRQKQQQKDIDIAALKEVIQTMHTDIVSLQINAAMKTECKERDLRLDSLFEKRDGARRRELKQLCKKVTDVQANHNTQFNEVFSQLRNINFFMGKVAKHMERENGVCHG